MKKEKKYCGYIAIMGKTNVGKSTLLNTLTGHKISITSHKKNTTQKNITGVKTDKLYQFIYIDTPGINVCKKNKKKIETCSYSRTIIPDVTLIIFIVNKNTWTNNDEIISERIKKLNIPIIIVINKIDKIKNKNILLPYIALLNKKIKYADIIPISAKKNKNIFLLDQKIRSYLLENNHIFSEDTITTNSQFFTISEIIREKLIMFLGDELPSIIKVVIESIKENKIKELYIKATIYVTNIRQKSIVIGKNGTLLKKCNILSRYDIERYIKMKVHLFLWVKKDKNYKK